MPLTVYGIIKYSNSDFLAISIENIFCDKLMHDLSETTLLSSLFFIDWKVVLIMVYTESVLKPSNLSEKIT